MSADVTRKKTLKMKKPPKAAEKPAEGAAAAAGPAPAAGKPGGAPAVAVSGGGGGYKFAGTCGILAVLVLAALLVVQWMEWSYYHTAPSAFPMQTAGMP